MAAPLEENLEDRKTGSLLEYSRMSPAKPWGKGEEGTHRALHLLRYGAGGELADSSNTSTSAPLHPDRHMMPAERREGLFWGEGEVRYNNGTDVERSVWSRHSHWCIICEHPRMISTCDGWRRHMREHEQVWPCLICARNDLSYSLNQHPVYTLESNLVKHLSGIHGHSEDAARILADEWKRTDTKKAYACGFCIQTFKIRSDQLNHIDQEHWMRGQNINEWDLNKVIHGLLLQPNILSSWRNLLRDTSLVIRDPTWNYSEAMGLIRRLELNEESADDLAAAAIAQLTPARLLTVSDSYGETKDSITRHPVEPSQKVTDITSDSSSVTERTSMVLDKLGRLTAEIECCPAAAIDISYEVIESISDQIKGFIEDFTRASWDWWPMKPRMENIPAGYARIRWSCVSAIAFHVARTNRPSLVTRSVTRMCQSFLQSRWLGLPPVPLMLQLSMLSKGLAKDRLLVIIRPVSLQHRLQHLTADNRANTRVVWLNMRLLSSKRSV